MSVVKSNALQLGQSLTATNNFTWYQPSTPDGTVRLGNGNSGSVTDLVTLTSAGALTLSGALSVTGNTTIGDAAGDTLTINAGTTTFAQGTANGVLYLNGSKVATSGSGLTFDGTNLGVGVSPTSRLQVAGAIAAGNDGSAVSYYYTGGMAIRGSSAGALYIDTAVSGGTDIIFRPAVSETARITSKGLLVGYTSDASLSSTGNAIFSGNVGIGTTSPNSKLQVAGRVFANGSLTSDSGDSGFGTGGSRAFMDWNGSQARIGSLTGGGVGGTVGLFANNALRILINTDGSCVWKPDASTSAMTLDASGQLQLGTTVAAGGRFKVLAGTNIAFGVQASTVISGSVTLNAINEANTANVPLDLRCSQLYVTSGITAGAGTNALKYNTANAAFTYDTSSARYKDNIRDSIYGLGDVLQLRSAMFEYKSDGRTDVGLIAEEVFDVIPELVPLDSEGRPDAVSYDRMVSVLVKAVQELHAEIETLKSKLN